MKKLILVLFLLFPMASNALEIGIAIEHCDSSAVYSVCEEGALLNLYASHSIIITGNDSHGWRIPATIEHTSKPEKADFQRGVKGTGFDNRFKIGLEYKFF
jgi:hypothetical protein